MDVVLVTGRDMPKADGESQLLVEALGRRGLRVTVQPWGEVDGTGVRWSSVPLVLVHSTWDYFLHRDAFLAWARDVSRETRLVNSSAVLDWNSHKGYLLDLEAAGVPVLETVLVEPGARPEELA